MCKIEKSYLIIAKTLIEALLQPDLNGAHPENSLAEKWLFGIAGVEGGIAAQNKKVRFAGGLYILKLVSDVPAETHIKTS